MAADLPPLSHVLETILYVKSMERARHFYNNILGLTPMGASPRGASYAIGNTVLLLFQLGKTGEDLVDEDDRPGYLIPRHGPTQDIIEELMKPGSKKANHQPLLRQHFCLAVSTRGEVERWEAHFRDNDVPVIGKKNWEKGGYSFYFTDPDGHVRTQMVMTLAVLDYLLTVMPYGLGW